MVAGRPRLGTFLIEQQIITEAQLDAAMQTQNDVGCRLGEALIQLGFCTDAQVALALAEQLEIPFVDLDQTPPEPDCVALLPRDVALRHRLLPVGMRGGRLLVATLDPYDIRVDEVLRRATGMNSLLAMAPERQLMDQIELHYAEAYVEPLPSDGQPVVTETATVVREQLSMEKLAAAVEHGSTIRVVNTLISDAVRRGASDLHIEPEEGRIRIRYRIDGRMCPATALEREILPNVVARIKIMCGMDISETRRPQDGGASLQVGGRAVELRASILPGVHGEIVTLRILRRDAGLQALDALGFQPEMLRSVRQLLASRHGVILVTGPTGSGKTTTLYAALNNLNREDLNIMTVEDPVEVKVPGINQVQIHDRAGRSFADTLRSMLRQDPDIIMVGEIRDVETADIAFRAALTGHLVLSTLHTQHALGSLARLTDMGVAPWMVSACLNGVLAQRLLRRVCESCAGEYTPPVGLQNALQTQFGSLDAARFRKGGGCAACNYTGHRGRVGVFELLIVDDTLRELLTRGAYFERLREHALGSGLMTLEQDAFRKAHAGLICPEELIELGLAVTVEEIGEVAAPSKRPAAAPRPRRRATVAGPPPADETPLPS
jgi:type IV pilus assembly protein PilB